ncbi:MAG TPA: hypothetical protein VNM39_11080 [Verrucomicrobiae bacterium]|nr:hypothetical protein [Verrucomicrobiae bacterium]
MARKFFYVCMGLLCVCAALGVGFRAARAQNSGVRYFAGVGGASAAVIGRTILVITNQGPTASPFPDAVPGSADIASVLVFNAGYVPPSTTVVLVNGDVYYRDGGAATWSFMGTYGGSPIPAREESWGQLKSRYR